jgi:propionyl-CoA synthetase
MVRLFLLLLGLTGCSMNGLFRNLGGMEKTYFQPNAGFYHTGDSGYLDSDGYLFIMTRTGDLINVAGHRLSTGSLEEALGSHPDVAECAVVGQRDPIKGQVPLGLVVLSSSSTLPEQQISAQCKALVRQRIGAVAAFKAVLVVRFSLVAFFLLVKVPRLPKTRSGKILRGVVQQMVDKDEWKVPATAEDPSVFDELSAILERSGV